MLQKYLKTVFIIMMSVIIIGCTGGKTSIPFASSLQDANVTLTSIKDGQHESLIVGNGDMYGIVWEKDNGLFMRITKNDIWDARIDLSEDGELPKVDITNSIITGEVGGPPSYRKTFPQPRAAVALRLGPVSSGEGFNADLDIEKAYVSIIQDEVQDISIRILHDRNVLLINSPHEVLLEEIKAETLPDAIIGKTDDISWLLMKMPGDIDYKGMDYAVAVASKGNIKAVSLVTSFDIKEGDVLEHAIKLARRTINVTKHNFNNSNVIFNIAKARLSMPEAVDEAKKWFSSRELPNGLFKWQGHAHGTFMGEMIGIAGLINEFLLQSVQNKIRLFPCWPADKDAKFSGLCAQGGFIVSSEFKEGRVVSTKIESKSGNQLQLLSPWKTVHIDGIKADIDPDGLVTLNTIPGQVLHFSETPND